MTAPELPEEEMVQVDPVVMGFLVVGLLVACAILCIVIGMIAGWRFG
jgi:hypothetical protein